MTELKEVYVLLAPVGQLSANGQLRETVQERRKKKGDHASFWYLSPELVRKFDLSVSNFEGVVAEDLTAINWLKLRLGGQKTSVKLDLDQLRQEANALPPAPNFRDISE